MIHTQQVEDLLRDQKKYLRQGTPEARDQMTAHKHGHGHPAKQALPRPLEGLRVVCMGRGLRHQRANDAHARASALIHLGCRRTRHQTCKREGARQTKETAK